MIGLSTEFIVTVDLLPFHFIGMFAHPCVRTGVAGGNSEFTLGSYLDNVSFSVIPGGHNQNPMMP